MLMVLCLECGHFQPGAWRQGRIEPIEDTCRECGGSSFGVRDGA